MVIVAYCEGITKMLKMRFSVKLNIDLKPEIYVKQVQVHIQIQIAGTFIFQISYIICKMKGANCIEYI